MQARHEPESEAPAEGRLNSKTNREVEILIWFELSLTPISPY